jgi:hypothetical protein
MRRKKVKKTNLVLINELPCFLQTANCLVPKASLVVAITGCSLKKM